MNQVHIEAGTRTRHTVFPWARPARSATTTTSCASILRMRRAQAYDRGARLRRWRGLPLHCSRTACVQAGAHRARANRVQLRKDAATYPLLLDGYQSSYEDEYQMRQVSGLHRDWLDRAAVSGKRAGCGMGGDYRGGHRQLRGHVSAARRARLLAFVRELAPRVDQQPYCG